MARRCDDQHGRRRHTASAVGRAILLIVAGVCLPCGILTAQTRPATTRSGEIENTPLRSLEAMANASLEGDEAGIRAHMAYSGPMEQKLADAMVRLSVSQSHLRKAALKAFANQDISSLVFGSPAEIQRQLGLARVTINGDEATIVIADQTIQMVRIDGKWKLDIFYPLRDWGNADVERLCGELDHEATIYDGLAKDVAREKFHTARQAAEELRELLLKPDNLPATRESRQVPSPGQDQALKK